MDTIKTLDKTLDNIDGQLKDMLLNAYVEFLGEEARPIIEKTLENLIIEIRPSGSSEKISQRGYWSTFLTGISNREYQILKEYIPKENQPLLSNLKIVSISSTLKTMLTFGIPAVPSEDDKELFKILGIDTDKLWGENSSKEEKEAELKHAQEITKDLYKKIRTDKTWKLYHELKDDLFKYSTTGKNEAREVRESQQKAAIDEEYFEKVIGLIKEYTGIDLNEKYNFDKKDIEKKVEFIHELFYSKFKLKSFLKENDLYSAFADKPIEQQNEFIDKFYSICFEHQTKVAEMKSKNQNFYFSHLLSKINKANLPESEKQKMLFYLVNHREGIAGFNYSTNIIGQTDNINIISLVELSARTLLHEFFHALGNRKTEEDDINGFYYKGESCYLNEAITEFVARKIMASYSGQTSILKPEVKNGENAALDYGAMIVLIEDLLESWLPKIKEYILSDDPDRLEKFKDDVGRENFDKLQDKLEEFYSLYSSAEESDFIREIAREQDISKSIQNKKNLDLNENSSRLYDLAIEIKQLAASMIKEKSSENESEL